MANETGEGSSTAQSRDTGSVSITASDTERADLSVPEISERLVEEVGIDEERALRAVRIIQEYSQGPIPNAAELERLNNVSPALGTQIAEDYLAQRRHERQMDEKLAELAVVDAARKDRWLRYASRGQLFGMASQLVFVGGAFYAMYLHFVPLALLLVAAPAFGVITQFIKGFESTPPAPAHSTTSDDDRKSS